MSGAETAIWETARAGGIAGAIAKAVALFKLVPHSLVGLVLRFAVAVPFYKSGLTKWDGFLQLSDSAVYLFSEELKLHLFGAEIAYPAPALMAFMAGLGEVMLPVLLVFGLGTRFAALGLIAMTAVIQLTIPEAWANYHLPWAAMLLAILAHGPGKISLDHLIAKVFRTR
ncbi:MAG: DoxX family protein [Hyphomicrobiales bacterium]|nr:DoxX family protein [Hyphomicrobiales bacterium]